MKRALVLMVILCASSAHAEWGLGLIGAAQPFENGSGVEARWRFVDPLTLQLSCIGLTGDRETQLVTFSLMVHVLPRTRHGWDVYGVIGYGGATVFQPTQSEAQLGFGVERRFGWFGIGLTSREIWYELGQRTPQLELSVTGYMF
jgi:hypothetical protein